MSEKEEKEEVVITEATCPVCKTTLIVTGSSTDFVRCHRCKNPLEVIWSEGFPRLIRSE